MLSEAKHLAADRGRPFASRRRDNILPMVVVKTHHGSLFSITLSLLKTLRRAIFGSPSLRGKFGPRRGEGGGAVRGGPLWTQSGGLCGPPARSP